VHCGYNHLGVLVVTQLRILYLNTFSRSAAYFLTIFLKLYYFRIRIWKWIKQMHFYSLVKEVSLHSYFLMWTSSWMLHYTVMDACLTSFKYCSNRVKTENVQILSLIFSIIFPWVHCVNPTYKHHLWFFDRQATEYWTLGFLLVE
jgi:hypothetical protein